MLETKMTKALLVFAIILLPYHALALVLIPADDPGVQEEKE